MPYPTSSINKSSITRALAHREIGVLPKNGLQKVLERTISENIDNQKFKEHTLSFKDSIFTFTENDGFLAVLTFKLIELTPVITEVHLFNLNGNPTKPLLKEELLNPIETSPETNLFITKTNKIIFTDANNTAHVFCQDGTSKQILGAGPIDQIKVIGNNVYCFEEDKIKVWNDNGELLKSYDSGLTTPDNIKQTVYTNENYYIVQIKTKNNPLFVIFDIVTQKFSKVRLKKIIPEGTLLKTFLKKDSLYLHCTSNDPSTPARVVSYNLISEEKKELFSISNDNIFKIHSPKPLSFIVFQRNLDNIQGTIDDVTVTTVNLHTEQKNTITVKQLFPPPSFKGIKWISGEHISTTPQIEKITKLAAGQKINPNTIINTKSGHLITAETLNINALTINTSNPLLLQLTLPSNKLNIKNYIQDGS